MSSGSPGLRTAVFQNQKVNEALKEESYGIDVSRLRGLERTLDGALHRAYRRPVQLSPFLRQGDVRLASICRVARTDDEPLVL